jgi:hypothetical protein
LLERGRIDLALERMRIYVSISRESPVAVWTIIRVFCSELAEIGACIGENDFGKV